ncbi:DUF2835 family protein [Gayadomonas joobiniege]|uniref:DUF2835 family protein n=1 Tax=Gayadomonas joobiniege TaxID=1234606 RepID=UPI0003628B6B|nr:DUF2835 family protein [Gayadomonas joobiniege]
MKEYYFSLRMSYSDCLAIYYGQVQHAVLISEEGVRVQLPVSRIRNHIDALGIRGRFRLLIDENNKIVEFVRVSH